MSGGQLKYDVAGQSTLAEVKRPGGTTLEIKIAGGTCMIEVPGCIALTGLYMHMHRIASVK